MKKSSCEVFALYFNSSISQGEDFDSTSIVNCVFNSFLCYTVIMLNIVTIHAIRKTSSLPKTLKALLLSLAVSDVGVGFLVQPFYISLLVKGLQQNIAACNTYKAFDVMVVLYRMQPKLAKWQILPVSLNLQSVRFTSFSFFWFVICQSLSVWLHLQPWARISL